MVVVPSAFGMVKATLEGTAFDPSYCLGIKEAPGIDFSGVAPALSAVVNDVLAISTGPRVNKEPTLQVSTYRPPLGAPPRS